MIRQRIVVRRRTVSLRPRIALTVVGRGEVRAFRGHEARLPRSAFRDLGPLDYVCGSCGSLLETCTSERSFATALLVCACGAVNQVPHDCAHA